MNPALLVDLPICPVSFSREDSIKVVDDVKMGPRHISRLEVSLFGDVEASKEGVLDCDLIEANAIAAAKEVIWQGVHGALDREISLAIEGEEPNLTITFTLHGANDGQDVTFELALLAGESMQLRHVFESRTQPVTFKNEKSQMTGTLGIRIVLTYTPLPPDPQHPVPVAVPTRTEVRFSRGKFLPERETVKVDLAIAGLAIGAVIIGAALAKVSIGFAAAAVAVGLGSLLNRKREVTI